MADYAADHQSTERQVTLRSLGPEFNEDHHGIYVRHLEEAVQEKKNRNIALTGRYGSGKSSVLDAFEQKHSKSTVRISINTLGPDETEKDLTNRIQKELVKQLIYRLQPGKIRRSRFARPKPLTKLRALVQAFSVSVIGLGILWLLGVRPSSSWAGSGKGGVIDFWPAAIFFALVVLAVWVVRWVIGDRIVSEVTTAGTKIALGEGPTTYFDSFLDEIVAFFDTVQPEFVIFEDLDRFDDPQIFDSLRELNTLINASVRWRHKTQPLKFIYAIKDSLFEQLGVEAESTHVPNPQHDSVTRGSANSRIDIASSAVQRANRTKFFEIVIPIVPFISHRNARDHLVDVLTTLGFAEDFVSRPLLDLIAQHTTDMRLMINICNEFAVFVERLLWTEKPAPGMTADHLFALVAYKNFHLADFEAISQRTSTLDELERHHRDDVRTLVVDLQKRRRKLLQGEEHRDRREEAAAELGIRFRTLTEMFPAPNGWPYTKATVGGTDFPIGAVDTAEFWESVAEARSFTVSQRQGSNVVSVGTDRLSRLFPEIADATVWAAPDAAELARLLHQYDNDIATLRGADFVGLALYEGVPQGRVPFDQRIGEVLKSELACDLVRRGFITINYSEYSAVFYGTFVGVDVAFFYNHAVQPNEMYVDYEFTSENAMSNLLEQVPADFTSSVSALNIQVVSHLLVALPDDAKQLVTYMATHDSRDVHVFLDAFLNAPEAPRERLVSALAAHPWRQTFEYLAGHPGMPDQSTRLGLFDAALLSAQHAHSYELGKSTQSLLKSSYALLTAVRESHAPGQTARIFAILREIELVVHDLGDLNELLRRHMVDARMYEINARNLRLALGIDTEPTLDLVRTNGSVWEFCRVRIADYLFAMESVKPGQPVILTPTTLVEVVNEQRDAWTDQQLRDVIERSDASAAIEDIREIPESTWPTIAKAGLMVPTVANVLAYSEVHGFDSSLSGMLSHNGTDPVELVQVQAVADQDRNALAVRLLNASAHLTATARVQLVGQLSLESSINLAQVTPNPDQLLARALEGDLVPDEHATFAHFAKGGWESVSEAFAVSRKVSGFISPSLLEGFVGEFVESRRTPDSLRRVVVEHLGDYVPGDDYRALRAAGRFAIDHQIWLALDDIRRIASVTRDPELVLRQLTHTRDVAPPDLSDILVSLGHPYDKLAAGPGMEFDLPAGSSNETLFKRLEFAGRIAIVPKLIGRGRKVRTRM